MPQYLGRAVVAYDGKTLETLPNAKITLGGLARKPVNGSHRTGYAEERKPATMECEISISSQTDVADIQGICAATVTYRADIGRTWMIANAFCEEVLQLTAGEGGKVKVKLTGDPAEEM